MPQITWTAHAWDDYLFWQKADKTVLKRINMLIKDAMRTPFEGIGKPEALRFDLAGYWSRRIDQEHRLVYSYEGKTDTLIIVQCRYHY
ncbi:Txe/YoeB family addiction module toxin [Oleidesulfovibrio sp.]|uniref:Txe/YoeB family addiction module toxin n=1 Tax=Oleidesulfovibrio sp. TaxID=2909707 RepID=UPI003A8AB0F2